MKIILPKIIWEFDTPAPGFKTVGRDGRAPDTVFSAIVNVQPTRASSQELSPYLTELIWHCRGTGSTALTINAGDGITTTMMRDLADSINTLATQLDKRVNKVTLDTGSDFDFATDTDPTDTPDTPDTPDIELMERIAVDTKKEFIFRKGPGDWAWSDRGAPPEEWHEGFATRHDALVDAVEPYFGDEE